MYDINLNYLGVNPPLTPPKRGTTESGVNPPLTPTVEGKKEEERRIQDLGKGTIYRVQVLLDNSYERYI
ncbi:hypothetical protein [Okeania sp. SIO2B3]|uniref:hypothetical protein n=1 Tax=Okeania sp. SIO2B3 TaxID=2607784 RepID=UPI0013C280D6|nr:hypothetical protein [Okeania sp. SIO2B3]NET46039.1 hypothetical protein [Okeania sp. SIO2B3]